MAANDQITCIAAANRDIPNSPPQAQQDCSDVIHISVFFDGTGNNKDEDGDKYEGTTGDEKKKSPMKWSNIARIWRSARLFADQNPNAYPVYISGVGTQFNGKPLFAGDEHLIELEDGDLGLGTGAGGTRRLDYGAQQVNDALRQALLARAGRLGGQVARYAQQGQAQSFDDVQRALGGHRLIRQINVSIFGFSRGAALARAFCNEWVSRCKAEHNQLFYENHPIRFVFLGLFDTVASFGLPATNTANKFAYGGFRGRDLVVNDHVRRCVHYVAAHELRFAFPVDLIRRDGKTDGRWLEEVYPGMHSDVGGGYGPDEQDIDNNYARIPMRDMMREACGNGTRLFTYKELRAKNPQVFQERFECRAATESAYDAYCAVCKPGGSVEEKLKAHMAQIYSAYGTLNRAGKENLTQRLHCQDPGKPWGPADMGKEIAAYERLVAQHKTLVHQTMELVNPMYRVMHGAYAMYLQPAQWQMQAWYSQATPGVVDFIDNYVHDSKYGFMNNVEPFSYFSCRGIYESNHSVQGWLDETIRRPTGRAYDKAADTVNKGIEKGKKAYDDAVDASSRGIEKVADKVQQAEAAAKKAVQDHVVKPVGNAHDRAVDATSRGIEKTVNAARQAGDGVEQGIDKATQEASNLLNRGWKFVSER